MPRKNSRAAKKAAEPRSLPDNVTATVEESGGDTAEGDLDISEKSDCEDGERHSPRSVAIRLVKNSDLGRRGRVLVRPADQAEMAINAEWAVPATAQDCAIAGVLMPASD